jgi:FMN-dependent NADH-azoreductase
MTPLLLHIDASPRRRSTSRRVSAAYAEAWRAAHPDGAVLRRDLGHNPLPPVDEAWTEVDEIVIGEGLTDLDAIAARLTEPAHRTSFWLTRELLDELLAADVVLIGTPMYNWSIPAQLKAWIDRVTFPWLPLAGKRAVVATARAGAYGPGSPREGLDLQEPYLRQWFGRLGVRDVAFLHSELTFAGVVPALERFERARDASHAAALERARELGGRAVGAAA